MRICRFFAIQNYYVNAPVFMYNTLWRKPHQQILYIITVDVLYLPVIIEHKLPPIRGIVAHGLRIYCQQL